jgi:hypothetical protein
MGTATAASVESSTAASAVETTTSTATTVRTSTSASVTAVLGERRVGRERESDKRSRRDQRFEETEFVHNLSFPSSTIAHVQLPSLRIRKAANRARSCADMETATSKDAA